MKIAILGTGAIGSALAYQLARAGHQVTTIARGARLAQLRAAGAIVLESGERAPVDVQARLDRTVPYDLVVVSVLAPQVAAVLDDLAHGAAKRVMFMFNTFESIEPLRHAVGVERCRFGFPMGIFGYLVEGELRFEVRSGTTVDDPAWAKVLTAAGIPTTTSGDMQAWLRSHAALVVPLMSIGVRVLARGAGIDWAEAHQAARAMAEGFAAVRALGHRVTPTMVLAIAALPRVVTAALLWALSRTRMLRELGKLGTHEPTMLIDQIARVWRPTPALAALRPAPHREQLAAGRA